jgi:acetyl/propionyl-CoA carboxylase alpha subunit
MTFEIELDGQDRMVSVAPAGPGRFTVTIDGRSQIVLASRIDEFNLSLIVDDGAGVSRELQVVPGGAPGELLVGLGGRTVGVTVNGRRTGHGAADAGGHSHGAQSVEAPMPGRVVRVLVGPGDEVSARQPVVVVEAMKMENELRAPKAGKVRDVNVSPGASVEAGKVLVVIE